MSSSSGRSSGRGVVALALDTDIAVGLDVDVDVDGGAIINLVLATMRIVLLLLVNY
jgi:hypothetical protein